MINLPKVLLIEIWGRPLALKGLTLISSMSKESKRSVQFKQSCWKTFNYRINFTIGRYWFRLIDKYVNLLIFYEAIQFQQGRELHKDYAALLQRTGKVDTSAADVGAETGECWRLSDCQRQHFSS